MIRNPRTWLVVAAAWLLLAGLMHAGAHLWMFVLENGFYGMREFAMEAMKQTDSFDPLRASLWRQFRAFSIGWGLLLFFTGVGNLLLVRTGVPVEALRTFTLLQTVFWTFAFGLFVLLDPVLQSIVVAAVAVPLHGIAYLTADLEVREAHAGSAAAPGHGSGS